MRMSYIDSDHYNEKVDLAHLPQDDPVVYDALQKADTIVCSRLRAGPDVLPSPDCGLKSLRHVVQGGHHRPGPIVGNWFILI